MGLGYNPVVVSFDFLKPYFYSFYKNFTHTYTCTHVHTYTYFFFKKSGKAFLAEETACVKVLTVAFRGVTRRTWQCKGSGRRRTWGG